MSKSQPVLTEAVILDRFSYLTKVGVLAAGPELDPGGWLGNFERGSEEHEYAVNLLGSFLYLPTRLFGAIFKAAMHSLSTHVASPPDRRGAWNEFLDRMLLTPVQDLPDRPASSGYAHARLAREMLRVPEDQILSPETIIGRVALDPAQPVVFVDDFVGTGEQFTSTWRRDFWIRTSGKASSFAALAEQGHGRYFYCPALATPHGIAKIAEEAPAVTVSPGTFLGAAHSAFHPESVLWPEPLRTGAEQFLREASLRAGIPDDDDSPEYWRGYRGQGLAVGFEGGAPDATLPIFSWEENGWTPFLRGAL